MASFLKPIQTNFIMILVKYTYVHFSQNFNVEITSFRELVPFLTPLVVLQIGTTTSAVSNSPSAASN